MIPISKPFIGNEEKKAVLEVMDSGLIAQGPKVAEAEEKLADICGTRHAVLLNSGTAGLHTSLHVAGIGKDDEVITTPFTFIATANPILMQGAKPVFADIELDTFNIDPKSIEEKITKKTKAIITVDLYGHLCDYVKIKRIADEHGLIVIEDACQAIGAEYNKKMAGSFGHMGIFSFYATKNITCGEGGAIVTNDMNYAKKAKLFRQHGMSALGDYDYNDVGYNYRTTDINAAILLEQLKKLDKITKKRIENAKFLSGNLENISVIQIPVVKKWHKHVFHQYTIKANKFKLSRDKLVEYLKKKGIGCSIYYPKPLHLCESFMKLGYKKGDFPVAEEASETVLSLPVHPSLKQKELKFIVDSIKNI